MAGRMNAVRRMGAGPWDSGSPESPAGGRWYVAHTLPHRELTAAEQLRRQGFETFLPLLWRTVRHARRFRTVKAAFFPRYLFVRLDLGHQRWRAVNGTLGVDRLVMAAETPQPVPCGVVEEMAMAADGDGILLANTGGRPALAPGQPVRLVAGPLSGYLGRLLEDDGEGRVRVLMEIMGGASIVATARTLVPAG
jgi:transcriptional antiterminator RfaH